MRFSIAECNMERLTKKANAISKKCAKYGCDFKFEEVGSEFKEIMCEDGVHTRTVKYIIVDVEGIAVINDWEFVAELDHTEAGNIIRGFGEHEVPERYYTAKPVCEHCGVDRYRKNTYIVRNKVTGEFKQVGKSCLRDFTGGMSVEAVASYISMFDELIVGDVIEGGGYCPDYFDQFHALTVAVEIVKRFGYRKSDEVDSTRGLLDDVLYMERGKLLPKDERMLRNKLDAAGFNADTDDNKEKAKAVIEWVLSREDNSNYFHNLKVAMSLGFVRSKDFGLIVSALPAYDKELEIERLKRIAEEKRKAEAKNSDFVGYVGSKVQFSTDEIKCVTSWENCYDGYHCTTTYLYKMFDEDGNVYTWKTAKGIDPETAFVVKGTVKEHTEYNGVKQTVLMRCSLTVEKKVAKKESSGYDVFAVVNDALDMMEAM